MGQAGNRITAALLLALTCGWLAGAAAAPSPDAPSAPAGPFPTPEELARLGEAPAPERLFDLEVAPVDEWTLEGPFPERVGVVPHETPGPFGALLSEFASSRAGLVVPSEGMTCVARELGRFYLAKRAQPTESLRSFITARCRAGIARVATGYVRGDVGSGEGEAQVFRRWQESVRRNLSRYAAGGPSTAGIWFGREGDHAVAMMAFGRRELHVDPFSPVAEDGRLEIRGEALQPQKSIGALVNRGRFGVTACRRDPETALPRFHFVCELDPEDEAAYLSIDFTPPDRLLSETGLLALASSGKTTPETWRAPRYTDARPVSPADDVAADFVAVLNGVRKQAGLSAVELDREQSRQAAGLAPHFFAGMMGQSAPLTSDLVVLGLMAGWQVDGIVQTGHFTAAWATESVDLSRLLSGALELPGSRETLLAPEVERVAVGPLLAGPEGRQTLAAVVATYRLFSERDHEESAKALLTRLSEARAARDLPPPQRLDEVSAVARQAAAAVQSGTEPRDAMRQLLEASSRRLGRSVSGWITEVSDLGLVAFPDEYLARPELAVGFSISHRKPPGEPWGHWVVMLVVASPRAQGA